MLRSMGAGDVYVLDGGLPAWEAAGFSTEDKENESYAPGDFSADFDSAWFVSIDAPGRIVVDARSAGRFAGTEPEPRDIPSGHMPGAVNVPFTSLLDSAGCYRQPEELRSIIHAASGDGPLTTTCGSGVTACVVGLAALIAGYRDVKVYDGSWTEWASTPGREIVQEG